MSLLSGVLCIGVALGGALQKELRPVVEQALDQPIDVQFEDALLSEAFETVSRETGVTVSIDPRVVDLLPYGPATEIRKVELRNLSLREGLVQLLAPMGMTFQVTDRGVEVLPTPGLQRLGRRATWPELKTLEWLAAARFNEDAGSLEALRRRVQFHVPQPDSWDLLSDAVKSVGAGPGTEVLEVAAGSLGWTWYPRGEQVVLLPLVDQMKRQLDVMISVRMSHRPLTEVLRHIGRQAGVVIRLGPGVADGLPIQTRKSFSLLADNVTAAEALEEIAGLTGLAYRIDADGVVLELSGGGSAPAAAAERGPGSRPRDPYVGKIAVPDPSGTFQIEFLVRESDLSPEVNALRKQLIGEADEVIERALREHLESRPDRK